MISRQDRKATVFPIVLGVASSVAALTTNAAFAQAASDEELAKQLSNPVASLISVPFQFNWDHEYGAERSGHKFQLNFQPVVPIKLNSEWNVISRTIVPIVDQSIPFLGDGSQSGVGDITQSFFFSPVKPTANGVIWGVGPAILIPTGTDFISADKWALGPTAVVLKQEGRLDLRCARQSSVVGRRQRRPGHQQHIPAAVHGVHDQGRVDAHAQHRIHLRLESGAVERSDQLPDLEAHENRGTPDQPWRRRSLLGRRPEHRSARLGRAGGGDADVPQVNRFEHERCEA